MLLETNSIELRYVEEADAQFILSLRLDEKYNKFLSIVSPDIESQKEWIRAYKQDESNGSQYYFIIRRRDDKTPCGTVRIYDLRPDSFCWGSWILNENKTRFAAIESALLVYQFGFEELKFNKCHFDVMKSNKNVISFHEKMGASTTSEDEENYYFEINKKAVNDFKENLKIKI